MIRETAYTPCRATTTNTDYTPKTQEPAYNETRAKCQAGLIQLRAAAKIWHHTPTQNKRTENAHDLKHSKI